jgi:hypothetical protein
MIPGYSTLDSETLVSYVQLFKEVNRAGLWRWLGASHAHVLAGTREQHSFWERISAVPWKMNRLEDRKRGAL